MKKISIVVPTFNNSQENLDRIIKSFDNQTMNQSEFEVIFVDDGSDDFQAFKRLKEKTQNRSNYVVHRIAPSGWASRPRNVGIKLARGEYIFFCDDDDTIFPKALELMYNFANENNLDVVNPKVIRTKGWSWGWNEFRRTIVGAQKFGIKSMGPMTVPKLYKKRFLIDHDLFFPEGERVWWEDVMYSCLVYSKKPNIGIFADYPVYHWRDQNRSSAFGKDLDNKWKQLTNLALLFEEILLPQDKDEMILHWYKSRVLGSISNNFHKKERDTQIIEFEKAREWRERFVNENIINNLDAYSKVLDKILEINKPEIAYSLSEYKTDITARSYLREIEFFEETIIVKCETTLTFDDKEAVKFKGNSQKVQLPLPKEVKKEIPKSLHYYTENDFQNNLYLPVLKGRFTRATWDIKSVHNSEFVYNKSFLGFEVSAILHFSINLEDYIHDKDDKLQPWDVATRFNYLDNFSQRAIACKEDFRKAAIINGNTYVVYKNNSGLLSIDMNACIINFFSVAKINTEKLDNKDNQIYLPIENVHVYGDSEIEILASIYNESYDGFVETTAKICTQDRNAFLKIYNINNLTGICTVHLALGSKSHELKIII